MHMCVLFQPSVCQRCLAFSSGAPRSHCKGNIAQRTGVHLTYGNRLVNCLFLHSRFSYLKWSLLNGLPIHVSHSVIVHAESAFSNRGPALLLVK